MSTDKKKSIKIVSWLLFSAIILVLALWYWRHTTDFPSTDDAYVQANVVNVAPEVSGRVVAINVKNNQDVKAGTILFQIDPKPYIYALKQAKAQYDLARQAAGADLDAVNVAKSLVTERQAELTNTQLDYHRIMSLVKNGTSSKSAGDDITSKLAVAHAALVAAKEQLNQALHKLGDSGLDNAQIRQAKAQLSQAELNLSHTFVKAPADGVVTNFTLRQGDIVAKGSPLFAFIEDGYWWVDANFKETQLARLRQGQPANIVVDAYPDHTFKGKLISISNGSGTSFSLLPPENATGNWVKVTQRFPVRVAFVTPDVKQFPLRVGSSSTVTVDTLIK